MSKYTENFPNLSTYDFDTIMCQLRQVCGADPSGLINAQFLSRPTTAKDIALLLHITYELFQSQVELQKQFVELYTFVKDFFENLDLQKEVNEWLDQALSDGTLENIVNKYTIPSWYNIVLHGAKNDGSEDVSSFITNGFLNSNVVYLPNGEYLLSKTIELPKGCTIINEGKVIYSEENFGIIVRGTYFSPSVILGGSWQSDNGGMIMVERTEKTWGSCLIMKDFVFTGKNFVRLITSYNCSFENGNVSFSNIGVDMLPVSEITETIPDNTVTNCNAFKNVHFEGQNSESTVFVRSTCSNNNVFYDCTFERGYTGIQVYKGVPNESRGDCRSLAFMNCFFENLKILATWKAIQNGLFVGYNNDRARPFIFNNCIFQVIEDYNDTNIIAEGKSPLGFRSDIERIFVPGEYTDINTLLPVLNNVACNLNNLVVSNADKSQTYDFGSYSPRYLRHIKNINATKFATGSGTEFSFNIIDAMYFGFYNELINIFGKVYVCVKGTNSSGNFAFEFDLFRLDTDVFRVSNYHKITGTLTEPTISWESDNTCKMVFTEKFTSLRVHTVFIPMDTI